MFCKKCGYKLDESSHYCPFCGTKTDQEFVHKPQANPQVTNVASQKNYDYMLKTSKTNILGFLDIGSKWLHHALIACIGYLLMYILIFAISTTMITNAARNGIDFSCMVESEDYMTACSSSVIFAYVKASSISQLIGELTVVAIVALIFRKYIKSMFNHFIQNKCYKWYLIGIGILYGGNIVYSVLLEMLQLTSTSTNQDAVNEVIYNMPFVGFLFVVVAAPLFEEIIFRFGVFRAFTHGNQKKAIIGLVLTTIIFAGVHMIATVQEVWADPAAPNYEVLKSDLLSLPVYLIGAFGLTFVYYKSKNIMTSMLVHMTYNGLAFLAILSLQNVEETTQCITNLVRLIFRM